MIIRRLIQIPLMIKISALFLFMLLLILVIRVGVIAITRHKLRDKSIQPSSYVGG